MKLAASNIGWNNDQESEVLEEMDRLGYCGLEIAPTRWFEQAPYEQCGEGKRRSEMFFLDYGFEICSMQSIWYGRAERVAGSTEEYQALLSYTEKALCFAEEIGCSNLVFGCPRNREAFSAKEHEVVEAFLWDAAELALSHHAVIALEPNPPIYHTNFVNTTMQAINLIRRLHHSALQLNLDFGTMIENGEDVQMIEKHIDVIHHVHISEPGLRPPLCRPEHRSLFSILSSCGYNRFVSLEMKQMASVYDIIAELHYLSELVV